MTAGPETTGKPASLPGLGLRNDAFNELPWTRRWLVRSAKVLSTTLSKFKADRCTLWSSALTFYTVMSIVPIAAVAFAVAKGFGIQALLQQRLMDDLADHREVVLYVMDFSQRLLENTRGGILAGAGIVVLFFSAVMVLGNIEQSFNNIWGVHARRPLGRKIRDYFAIMLIAPALIITAGSAKVMITMQMQEITSGLGLGMLTPLVTTPMRLIPFCLVWGLLTFLYIFAPNTKVKASSGITGGLVAGVLFLAVQKGYIYFQVVVAQYNAIYGSFAALPLFLLWQQLSWLIVLAGAELSYACQNSLAWETGRDIQKMSGMARRLVSLSIAHHVVADFAKGGFPLSASDISRLTGFSPELTAPFLNGLCEAGVLVRVEHPRDGNRAYMPARDPDILTVSWVLEALEGPTGTVRGLPGQALSADLQEILKDFGRAVEASPANRLLKDIPV